MPAVTDKLRVEIPDCSPEALTERIRNGLEICNTTLQKLKTCKDEDLPRLSGSLDKSARRLDLLVFVGHLYGVDSCVFGSCRDSEEFTCLACSRKQEVISGAN